MNVNMKLAELVVRYARQAYSEGLMTATSGNLSIKDTENGLIAITPSGVRYDNMSPEDIVWIDIDGRKAVENRYKPSSEWKMHAEIYRAVDVTEAVVHTHSPNATAFAALRKEIPCVLVESLLFLGGKIEVADYALQGSREVGLNAVPILKRKPVCLLANHGTVAVGRNIEEAFARSQYLEDTAKIVRMAMSTGLKFPEEIGGE